MTSRSGSSGPHLLGLWLLALVLSLPLSTGCRERTGLALGEERVQENEEAIARGMVEWIREVSLRRAESDGYVRRFNQLKTIGCVDARLIVPELPTELAQGLFSTPSQYAAYVRFANATSDDDRDADFRGMSFRVDGVAGAFDAAGAPASRQDFLLNSHPALFSGTPDDFLEFIRASANDETLWHFLNPLDNHLYSLRVVLAGRDEAENPLALQYWSTTPFRFGESERTAVKFSAAPCPEDAPPRPEPSDHEDFLRDAMVADIADGGACFELMVQFQTDPDEMPIENAAATWSEALSPFQPVARLVVDAQSFTTPEAMTRCEAETFNPWNALPAHRPLGGVNRVRKVVYDEVGSWRRAENAR